tara:strand:- start:490 stop:732 length:243 start_codon:yes stop_codon:yes gene_type:complete
MLGRLAGILGDLLALPFKLVINSLWIIWLAMLVSLHDAQNIRKERNIGAVLITAPQDQSGSSITEFLNRSDLDKYYHSTI